MAREWQFEQSGFMNRAWVAAEPAWVGSVEVTVEPESVGVEVVQGSGYLREQTNASIPVEVLVRLLEHAGFSVTRR